MLVNNVRTSIVAANNNGFGGAGLNNEMAGAVGSLSSNESLREQTTKTIAAAMQQIDKEQNKRSEAYSSQSSEAEMVKPQQSPVQPNNPQKGL